MNIERSSVAGVVVAPPALAKTLLVGSMIETDDDSGQRGKVNGGAAAIRTVDT